MGLGHGSSLSWWNLTGGTDSLRTYIATNKVVQSGLVLNLDAGASTSYVGSGTTWTDLSGNGNTGTLTNGPTYSSSNGGSIAFDGADDYVSIAGSRTLSAATFIVWIKRNGNQNNFAGILISRSGSVNGLNFYATTNNLGYHWSSDYYYINSGLTIPDNTWCMCTVAVTSTAATLYLFQSSGTTTVTNTASHSSTRTLSDLRVGYDPTASRYLNGNIATAQIYNRALSAAEISQNFNALRGRFGV